MNSKAKEFTNILSKKLNYRYDFSEYEYKEFVEAGYIDLFNKLDYESNCFKFETTNGYAALLVKWKDSGEFKSLWAVHPYEVMEIGLLDNCELYYFSEAEVEMYEKKLFGNKTTFQNVRKFEIAFIVLAIIIAILVLFITIKSSLKGYLFVIFCWGSIFTFFRIKDDERIYENKLKKKRETFIDGYKRGL